MKNRPQMFNSANLDKKYFLVSTAEICLDVLDDK